MIFWIFPCFSEFSQIFPDVFNMFLFLGATSSCALIPNVGVHVANHLGWEEMLNASHNQSVMINGYILTGWQRYDHFASLCEFLPVAIPSLKCCLIALQRGKFDREEVEEAKKVLGKLLKNNTLVFV